MLSSVFFILLQVCGLQLMVVAMPTCPLQGHLVESAHHLLKDVGGHFPVRCLPYNANISFPSSAFTAATANHAQCRRALWVLHQSLDQTGTIFETQELPVGEDGASWDEKKFENFQNIQHQLLDQGSCLSGSSGSGVLSQYFSNVTAVLQQGDVVCGWMALRRDLLWVLKSALQKHRSCFTWRDHH